MRRRGGFRWGGLLLTGMIVGLAAFANPKRPLPSITVYKNPGCACCNGWVAYLRQQGFEVSIDSTGKVTEINAARGVSEDLASCHTALVGDYVVVGHVPVDAILKLLEEHPPIRGISAPGMPTGAPGMEMPGMPAAPFSVMAIDTTGKASVFAEYGKVQQTRAVPPRDR